MKMLKKLFKLTKNDNCLITLLFLISTNLFAEVIDVSTGMPSIAATIGISSITVKVKDIRTNVYCSSVTWGSRILNSGWQLADRYIELGISCNYSFWRLEIYTNNTNANTGYQKAGLISTSTNTLRIPLAWLVSGTTISITNVGEPGPLITNEIHGSTTSLQVGWTYMKDKGDQDDPNTDAWDESWDNAHNSGYTTVCYETGGSMNLCYGIKAASPVKIYLEALTDYVLGKMFYSTTIWFDITYY